MIINKRAELVLTEKEADLIRELNTFIEEHFENDYDLMDEFKTNFMCHLIDWDDDWTFENIDVRIIS